MIFLRNKYLIILAIILVSCLKDDLNEKNSNEFDASGKTFQFYPFGDSTIAPTTLIIPANAVSRNHYVEYNTFLISTAYPIDSFQINYSNNDIHHFRSSCDSLSIPAQLSLTFPTTITFNLLDGFRPYKIKLDSTRMLYEQLNEVNRWTEISIFTFDNSGKTVTFETTDLNACYVIAKPQ